MTLTHGSLFSGIGGFDLAAEWMGWENKFHCEWNDFGQKVLKHYWPNAESFNDITKTDFTKYANRIDVLTGGFPCQPYSIAGKRKGKEDERHLWPQMLRAIREIQPGWVVGENVFGLINWSDGLVFDQVQADLEASGYEVFPYVLPAAAVNAPHRRDRVWFVAYCSSNRRKREGEAIKAEKRLQPESEPTGELAWRFEGLRGNANVAHPNFRGRSQHGLPTGREVPENGADRSGISSTNPTSQQGQRVQFEQREYSKSGQREFGGNGSAMGNRHVTNSDRNQRCERGMPQIRPEETKGFTCSCNACSSERITWDNFPTQSPICSGNDGIPAQLDGITFSKWRNESIKAAGNAIVPQVVLQIFKSIQQYEDLRQLK